MHLQRTVRPPRRSRLSETLSIVHSASSPESVNVAEIVSFSAAVTKSSASMLVNMSAGALGGAPPAAQGQERHGLLLVACLIFSPGGQAHKGFGGSYPLSERPRKVSPCEARTYPAVIIEPGFGTRAG